MNTIWSVPASAGSINFNFTTGSLPAGITFTRASSGSYFNSSNVLQVFGASTNVPRFDYMISGSTPTLLYEPAATNLFLQSNTFTTTWSLQNSATATGAAATSPDGTTDAWGTTGTASAFSAIGQSITYNGTSTYVDSLYVLKNTAANTFDLGIVGSANTNSATTSWVRYAFDALSPASGTDTTFAPSSNGSAAWSIFQFGAQLEVLATSLTTPGPTSYIPTTTVAVTRAADQMAFTIPSGVGHLIVTFSDNTTQTIAVSPGPYTLTNSLNEFNINSIVGTA
jgi:hypothetical protein